MGLQTTGYFSGLASGLIDPARLPALAALPIVSTIAPVFPPLRHTFVGTTQATARSSATGPVIGQGVQALHADLVHDMGVTGARVKVGVMSNSFAFFSAQGNTRPFPLVNLPPENIPPVNEKGIPQLGGTDSQLSEDLPPRIDFLKEADPYLQVVSSCTDPPVVSPNECVVNPATGKATKDLSGLAYDDEGRALAEVVYDIAPGAQIAYYVGASSPAAMAQGILRLAEIGSRVIVDDITFPGEPLYQDGEISQAIEQVAGRRDVVYVAATGNSGALSFAGQFLPTPEQPQLHNWDLILTANATQQGSLSPYLAITLAPNAYMTPLLYWENPFSGALGPGATTDYDFYLLAAPNLSEDTIVAEGINRQGVPGSPAGDPVEVGNPIANNAQLRQLLADAGFLTSAEEQPITLYLVLKHVAGPAVNWKFIFQNNPRLNVNIQGHVSTRNPMQFGHQMAKYALSVGAVNYLEVESNGKAFDNPDAIDPTYYSSFGGNIRILYTPNGESLAVPELRFKPDIVSVDGVNTSFFEGSGGDYPFDEDDLPNFLGTSCASPHAAGVIALMRQTNPFLSAEQIRTLARSLATDIGLPGVDPLTGSGLLFADTAVKGARRPFAQ
jgi:subtilisin family serine protease